MQSIAEITQETLNMIKPDMMKAQSQGYTVGMGLTGYELEAPSKKLFPVLSPFRNRVPRKKAAVGSQAAHWKAITKINSGHARPTVDFGVAGSLVQTDTREFQAAYRPIALGDTVQMDAQMLAQGFEDLRATSGTNLLYALMIEEDRLLLGAQNFSLGRPQAPSVEVATTGGSIGAVTVYVAVAARTLENYFYGGGTQASPVVNTGALTGTTNKVTASVAAVKGAVAYDWFVGTSPDTLFYLTTTTINKVDIVSVPTEDQPAPFLADFSGARTYADAQTDTSADPNAFNGLIASVTGDWYNGTFATAGTGEPTGVYWKSFDGAQFHGQGGAIPEIDEALLRLWDQARVSPTAMLVNAQQHIDITQAVIQSSGGGMAYTLFRPDQLAERQNLVGGALLATYMNKAVNGRPIPIETHPHVPPGTVILITEVLPYPNNQVANVFEVETQQEYQQIEYAMARKDGPNGGPRYDTEVRAIETFKNYFPAGCVILQNIAPGVVI